MNKLQHQNSIVTLIPKLNDIETSCTYEDIEKYHNLIASNSLSKISCKNNVTCYVNQQKFKDINITVYLFKNEVKENSSVVYFRFEGYDQNINFYLLDTNSKTILSSKQYTLHESYVETEMFPYRKRCAYMINI